MGKSIEPQNQDGKARSSKIGKLISFGALFTAVVLVAYALSPLVHPSPTFSKLSIQVVDADTARPLSGVVVTPLCMGLSPYPTNSYTTDQNGRAEVNFYSRSPAFAAQIKLNGYATEATVIRTNPVVRLAKVQ